MLGRKTLLSLASIASDESLTTPTFGLLTVLSPISGIASGDVTRHGVATGAGAFCSASAFAFAGEQRKVGKQYFDLREWIYNTLREWIFLR